MIISEITVSLPTVRSLAVVDDFRRPATRLTPSNDGELVTLSVEATTVVVEWLAPFGWDADLRGVVVRDRRLEAGEQVVLHAGPYGTADAVAGAAGRGMRFTTGSEGPRYTDVDGPGPDDVHPDAAGWLIIGLGGRSLVMAWDYSGTVTAAVVYKAWRRVLRTTRISRPDVKLRDLLDDRRLGPVEAVQANLTDGRAIMAISVPPGATAVTVRPRWLRGAYQLTDEWTGTTRSVTLDDAG